jgi:hypothetical protein
MQATTATGPDTGSAADPAYAMRAALSPIWEGQYQRVLARIAVIEEAVLALSEDRLAPELRREAEHAAHMLGGSIGMFGFVSASDAALCLEPRLANPTPADAPTLLALVRRVRRDVQARQALAAGTR